MSLYHQFRTCGKCGHEESREISALVAAFEERRKWTEPCAKCRSASFSSVASATPSLSAEILEEWSANERLTLLQQDEDLVMADVDSFDLLTKFVQRRDIPGTKRAVLLSALCVLVYDNTPDDDNLDVEVDLDTATATIQFLRDNHWLFQEIGDEYIYDYIKADVYPLIGLPLPNAHDN